METGHPQIDDALRAAQVFASDPKKFALLSIYLQRTYRDMLKALATLQTLQAERKARGQEDLEELGALLEYNESRRLPVENTAAQGANGFVFSLHQIHAFASRKRQLRHAEAAQNKQNTHANKRDHGNRHNQRPLLTRAA